MSKFLWYLAGLIVATHSTVASAADFSALVVGQPVSDNTIKIGQFQLQLPAGSWTVLSAVSARQGNQSGAGSAVPTQLVVALARVEAGRVSAFFTVRTPASSFVGVRRWSDDPCASFTSALVKDTLNQTFALPECLAIVNVAAGAITGQASGPLAEAAKWLMDSKIAIPDQLLRVYYTKYSGGDFLHTYMYLPSPPVTLASAEVWGRAAAQALGKMVTRESESGVLPALPSQP